VAWVRLAALTQAAFTNDEVTHYQFGIEIDFGQLPTTLFTVNKHWAPHWFHGRTPIVLVVCYGCIVAGHGGRQ
jgi:hypothetical protein